MRAGAIPSTPYVRQELVQPPTRTALMTPPSAFVSLVLAPLVGLWMTTHDPRWMAIGGFASLGVGLLWLSRLMDPATSVPLLLAPFFLIGLGNALVWGPLSLTATRNLPPSQAGAGSG